MPNQISLELTDFINKIQMGEISPSSIVNMSGFLLLELVVSKVTVDKKITDAEDKLTSAYDEISRLQNEIRKEKKTSVDLKEKLDLAYGQELVQRKRASSFEKQIQEVNTTLNAGVYPTYKIIENNIFDKRG